MRRIPELDALRGLASVVIVFHHADLMSWIPVLGPILSYGWGGVDLFFVLSGYLITSIIFKSGEQPHFFKRFYVRRGLRIWPIYYLLLLGVIVVNLALPSHPIPMRGMPQYLTYTQEVQAYVGREMPGRIEGLVHTWTLAIEEQFYLIWPVLVLLAPRRWLFTICVAIAMTSMLVRSSLPNLVATRLHLGHVPLVGQYILLGRCDGFALGGILALVANEPGTASRRNRLMGVFGGIAAVAGAILVVGSYLVPPNMPFAATWTTLLSFGVVGMVLLHTGSEYLRPLRWGWLCYLGLISYGLYLWHPMVFRLFEEARPNLGSMGWVTSPLMVLASLVVAMLSWKYVERPFLSFKDRFDYEHPSRELEEHLDELPQGALLATVEPPRLAESAEG